MSNKICEVCGKSWDYQYKVIYGEEGKAIGCYHDGEFRSSSYEIIPSSLRQERKQFAKEILQPYKKDGSINQDYVRVYGKDNIAYQNNNK